MLVSVTTDNAAFPLTDQTGNLPPPTFDLDIWAGHYDGEHDMIRIRAILCPR